MTFPWRLYLAATLVGAFAGLIGGTFHALLDQAAASRSTLRAFFDSAPVPGWLLLMLLGSLVLVTAMWLVRRFAPETAGSGVQEVEAILAGDRQLRWKRVLPVKFVAGTLAVGSGLVLGREGPTIHMGAALGQLASERLEPNPAANRALIAAGAAAGLATAFNAPLASIVFVTEELREHFEYRFATIQSVILACCAAVVVSGWMLGQGPDMSMPDLNMAPLETLPLFLLLGVLIGALGVLFNRLLLGSVASYRALGTPRAYAAAALTGLMLGALLWFAPNTVGGGESLVERLLQGQPALLFLIALFAVRLLTTIGSYGLGLPGGIFAPMLALGTICGAAFAALISLLVPTLALAPEVFAVAAMGALFAATVRAPLTGIILVIELTGAQALALPIILTCLAATFTAEGLGGRPVYSSLLGLQHMPPPRTPVRRIAAAAMILVAFIAIERIDIAFQGTGMELTQTLAETEQPSPLPSPSSPSTRLTAPGSEPAGTTPAGRPTDKPDTTTEPDWVTTTDLLPDERAKAERAAAAIASALPNQESPPVSSAESVSRAESVSAPEGVLAERNAPPPAAPSPAPLLAQPADRDQRILAPPAGDAQATPVPVAISDRASDRAEQSASADPIAVTEETDDQNAATAATSQARFSIQLISFRNPASVTQFADAEGLLGRALQRQARPQSAGWHAVLLGAYADRAAAETALAELPERLQRLKPIIRPLAAGERLVVIEAP
ncbi:H(+)/Cl(-) exchange transporter ClcA [Lamprobacter modestohalophilus]|uniref:H(+)/Cl(-) exchange transporter ClcA n=1 Tax=Lamprobacter modestohalophilus TaxID=1064514 RepID=UPI002ADEF555|nr:H(+)/Cl(-) exchange transporter ClcA [Lamprobacter modestohalophilus]MEA1052648.1 H(+)/Cl(-) exchange transporter ClcA [Lamprobacter modestohalophilus]